PSSLLWKGDLLSEASNYTNLDPMETAFIHESKKFSQTSKAEDRELSGRLAHLTNQLNLAQAKNEDLAKKAKSLECSLEEFSQTSKAKDRELSGRLAHLTNQLNLAQAKNKDLAKKAKSLECSLEKSIAKIHRYKNYLFLAIFVSFMAISLGMIRVSGDSNKAIDKPTAMPTLK
ncbi:MAG: hypothetical protein AAGC93_22065, partial [Cyanobacteria bacterium P01_F01_bin.53]